MKRAPGVTLLALYEFFKAIFLLVLLGILSLTPEALSGAGSFLRLLISLATNHLVTAASPLNGKSLSVLLLFVLYAISSAIFGFGLWFLQRWARILLMAASAIYLIRYARAFMIGDLIIGRRMILAEPTFTAVAMVDAIILMNLYIAKEAFAGAAGQR